MKLTEKGHQAPPPRLPPHAQRVAAAVSRWPGIVARAHWHLGDETIVDGADFYFGDEEVGHLHLDGEAHVMLPEALAQQAIRTGWARPLRWSRSAAVRPIAGDADCQAALRLFAISYDRHRGVPLAELSARLREPPPPAGD